MSRKVKPKLRAWTVMSEAVGRGLWFGLRRAAKHGLLTFNADREAAIVDYLVREVMNGLSEVVDFEDGGK